MPIVGSFDPRTLIASSTPGGFAIDFYTITLSELQDFVIPFVWQSNYTGIIHGIAGWFDLHFAPSPFGIPGTGIDMTTSPSAERTHWQQVRLLLKEPLAVNAGQLIRGWLHCVVNEMRSYNLEAELVVGDCFLTPPNAPEPLTKDFNRRRSRWQLHEQTYNYSYYPQPDVTFRPEYSCLYEPDQSLDVTVVVGNDIEQGPSDL
jgi:type I protein arginine methyltransferase